MSELAKHYSPRDVESKWYSHWEESGYFQSEPDDREPYSIVIPPPNVTGMLHMGHMLNNTVQDILIRKARLDGKNACWVPGTDHASIATEAKVVRMLRQKGISKGDLTREEFLEYAWRWKEKYGGIILQQLRRLGASCDWERTAFTMDEERSESVIQAFVDLYHDGKLYRDYRMVNWDPEGRTVLSNEEVIYSEETTQLCHVRYRIADEEDSYVTIATTRPETILGDTAVAVHPDDERYQHLKGKKVIVPMVDRVVPIIFDDYVDQNFGTGALKITPAHDPNDYEIGKRHGLETIDIFNDDATISELAGIFVGQTREEAYKSSIGLLQDIGALVRLEEYNHSVGRSERTGVLVEPKLSLQWYVDMKAIAKPALDAVETDEVEFFPKQQKNIYRHWMENIRDWCISRQLWWGHRIPAYYMGDDVFVAATPEEALQQARKKLGDQVSPEDLRQDEDVLDTWFSSWLWPITCFRGFQGDEQIDYYYPTSVLVTGWDIIFLWVARMIMAGYQWRQERPFKHVYFTGMVRDKQRRKMSKSLGNSPDALDLIDRYGADGVRFGVLSSSPAGGDLLFDEKLCEQGRNFCNKIWNALRLVKGWSVDPSRKTPPENLMAIDWIKARFEELVRETEKAYSEYRLSDVTMASYSFTWTEFCSWYLEIIKPAGQGSIDRYTRDETLTVFEKICICLHPIMPFITEEVYHRLKERTGGNDCMVAVYPEVNIPDEVLLKKMEAVKVVVVKLREMRSSKGIKSRKPLTLLVEKSGTNVLGNEDLKALLMKLAYLEKVEIVEDFPANGIPFLAADEKYFVPLEEAVDTKKEKERIMKELDYARGFLASVQKKLANERFVNNAPESVVAREKKKLADGEARLKILEESLESITGQTE